MPTATRPALHRSATARVLFDEAHHEAWSIRPDVARAMQPRHFEDSSYARAAALLGERDFTVTANADAALDADTLDDVDVLVIAHPSEPRWERTVASTRSPRFADDELDAIEAWVRAGGGLVVLGECEADRYGTNLDALLARFGLGLGHALVSDYVHFDRAPTWVLGDLRRGATPGADLLARVEAVCFYRAGALTTTGEAGVLARSSLEADPAAAPLLAVTQAGAGRIVLAADSDLFGDDCIGEHDHAALWLNLAYWAGGPAFAGAATRAPSAATDDAAWAGLKGAVAALRLMQEPDGSIDLGRHDEGIARDHVGAMTAGITRLAPRFPHQADHLAATVDDLARWAADGFRRPDFGPSLERFRPDLHREDGVEHLVVFPMYKQNASRATCFEALVVRVPWPAWAAELEATHFDNAKFVPVTLVDHTDGYDSECAVLFPETVATAGPPPNHFGGIFCDREAERFRRVAGRAVRILGLDLPPDASALLESAALSRDAFILWDLVHDRAHGHGDLPFDPFMIRQRMPYWMYSLEELRCDLTAFDAAATLEAEGFAFARHAQYAILFDRLFRFPVTGSRVRNYDGLGGQLLFAHLHREGIVRWTDNRLSIDWCRVTEGVAGLRERVETLYRDGIDMPRIAHWIAAHELVAALVPPNVASAWTGSRPALVGESDPKAWVDAVRDDEFPLSIFYTALAQKLAADPGSGITVPV